MISTEASLQAGQRVGSYRLLQQIGEGGCGVVFMAEQEEPIRRKVALKVIKLGMDTHSVIARFEAERQALALMDHPNIAKVFDAGATETGRPYFVMELVRGVKITEYCDQHKLTTRARLELFMQVCRAIQHAHQKGIIHRDIKPSNILVTLHDGVPVPKVIDFGIAKATSDQRLTEKTIFTAFEQFMGTPAYMSPEQAEMSGLDIDTRTDIYSLGVLLYELLTGKTPFDGKELLACGLEAMVRTIREKEPAKPSTRLGTIADDDLGAIASHRKTEPNKLSILLRGDLDWIVMKALEKDRTRRYETPSNFTEDIKRYLANEAVNASAPSIRYRLGKWTRRNKVPLCVGATIACLAIAFFVSLFLLFKEWRVGRYGGITVKSNPTGAEVWHEGRKIGQTPLKMDHLPPGEFVYNLVLENYQTALNTNVLERKKHMSDFTFLRQATPIDTNLTRIAATSLKNAVIMTMQGVVEVAMKGGTNWMSARTNMVLAAGDLVRILSQSRAVLRLSDSTILRVDENSILEIFPPTDDEADPPSLKINKGRIEFFPKSPGSNSIVTPNARAKITG
jgi:serine/threonine protein kinase